MHKINRAEIKIFDTPVPYKEAYTIQIEAVQKRKNSIIPDTLFLLEHQPVITLGKNSGNKGIVASTAVLKEKNITIEHIERGGQATYHAPGQLIGYPIVNLHSLKMGAAKYVYNLEEVMIKTSKELGVNAVRRNKLTGVFADIENYPKIGALGLRITNGITFHGFALNINMDLSGYNYIVPCGIKNAHVASIYSITKNKFSMPEVMNIAAYNFNRIFYDN